MSKLVTIDIVDGLEIICVGCSTKFDKDYIECEIQNFTIRKLYCSTVGIKFGRCAYRRLMVSVQGARAGLLELSTTGTLFCANCTQNLPAKSRESESRSDRIRKWQKQVFHSLWNKLTFVIRFDKLCSSKCGMMNETVSVFVCSCVWLSVERYTHRIFEISFAPIQYTSSPFLFGTLAFSDFPLRK